MNCPHPKRNVMIAVAAMPGRTIGSTMRRKICSVVAPSTVAASSMLGGSAWNMLYMIHIASGRKPEV